MPLKLNFPVENCCNVCKVPTLVVDALSFPGTDVEPTMAVLQTLPAAAWLEALAIRHQARPGHPRLERLVALLVDSLLLHREALCRLTCVESPAEDDWRFAEDVVDIGIRSATDRTNPTQVRVDIGMILCAIEAAEEEADELRPTYTTAEA